MDFLIADTFADSFLNLPLDLSTGRFSSLRFGYTNLLRNYIVN